MKLFIHLILVIAIVGAVAALIKLVIAAISVMFGILCLGLILRSAIE